MLYDSFNNFHVDNKYFFDDYQKSGERVIEFKKKGFTRGKMTKEDLKNK